MRLIDVTRLSASRVFVAMAVLQVIPAMVRAQTETVLYSFCQESGCADGAGPYGGVILDKAGNLYGTTTGGTDNAGNVYEIHTDHSESVLYSFCSQASCVDGTDPIAGVIMDSKGNIYGTTYSGGVFGYGVVFELSQSGGSWTESVLHSFAMNGTDGNAPSGGLLIDAKGNLYGTTSSGGSQSGGIVFELSPSASGTWTETILYAFLSNSSKDGQIPFSGVIPDKEGNLYGTTELGGAHGDGTVFELVHSGSKWSEKVLYSFGASLRDGVEPYSALTFDKSGNLYGTTFAGGQNLLYGTLFELVLSGTTWTETVLHSFNGQGNNGGCFPIGGMAIDTNGKLYGTTSACGQNTWGTVFELIPNGSASKEIVLHQFGSGNGDGEAPTGTVVLGKNALYGTTGEGGTANAGTVFEITP